MIGADVIKQGDHSLTVHSRLNAKVADIKGVPSEPSRKAVNKLIVAAYQNHTYMALILLNRALAISLSLALSREKHCLT